jgi:hypothetical protein
MKTEKSCHWHDFENRSFLVRNGDHLQAVRMRYPRNTSPKLGDIASPVTMLLFLANLDFTADAASTGLMRNVVGPSNLFILVKT